jgi:hypothetical protein
MGIKKYNLEKVSHTKFEEKMWNGSSYICKTPIMAISEQVYLLEERSCLRDKGTVNGVRDRNRLTYSV